MSQSITCGNKPQRASRRVRWIAVLSVVIGSGVVGCQGAPIAYDVNDPLYGGGGIGAVPYPGRQAPPPPPRSMETASSGAEILAIPTNNTRSLAALTNNKNGQQGFDKESVAPEAALLAPRAISDARTKETIPTTIIPTSHIEKSGVGMVPPAKPVMKSDEITYSYEELQQMLQTRGVTSQRLLTSSRSNEWHFHCTIPDSKNKGMRHNYEATATGALGKAAMWAAIQKIDKEQQR